MAWMLLMSGLPTSWQTGAQQAPCRASSACNHTGGNDVITCAGVRTGRGCDSAHHRADLDSVGWHSHRAGSGLSGPHHHYRGRTTAAGQSVRHGDSPAKAGHHRGAGSDVRARWGAARGNSTEIGRASCRERVEITVVAVAVERKEY